MPIPFNELIKLILLYRPTHVVINDESQKHVVESHVKLLLSVLMYKWYHFNGNFSSYPVTIEAVNRYLKEVIGKPFGMVAGLLHTAHHWPVLEAHEFNAIRERIIVPWTAIKISDHLPDVLDFLRDFDVQSFGTVDFHPEFHPIKVVDKDGNPVPDAQVSPNQPGGIGFHDDIQMNQETRDQIAKVLLLTGTPEQQLEAGIASGAIKVGSEVLDNALAGKGLPLGVMASIGGSLGNRFPHPAHDAHFDTEHASDLLKPTALSGNVLTDSPNVPQDKE